jgi:predicted HTH transcriptional regulator
MGYIERYGFGITNMIAVVEQHPFTEISFELLPTRTDVTFQRIQEKHIDDIDQKIIAMLDDGPASSSMIGRSVNLSRPAVVARLKKLIKIGLIRTKGKGPSTTYFK